MDPSSVTLPLELDAVMMDFPRGIYEIETTGVDYELVFDPVPGYLGALIVDRTPDEPEPETARRLSVVSFFVAVGESAVFVTQDEDFELKVRKTPEVLGVSLIKLYETPEESS